MGLLTPEQVYESPSRIFVPFQLTEKDAAGFGVQPVIKRYDMVYKPEALRKAVQHGLEEIKAEDKLLLRNQADYILAETVVTILQRLGKVKCLCYRFPDAYEEIEIGGSNE